MDPLRALLSAFVLAPIAGFGCGGGAGDNPVDAGPDAGDGCPELSLGERDFSRNLFGQLTGVSYAVAPGLGGSTPERLLIELYDSTTDGLPPLATGSFRLDLPPDDDLATCQHCVWLPLDWNGVDPFTTILLAREGEMTLTRVVDPLEPVFAGSIRDVVLREATLDDTGHATLVPGGLCARVETLAFDTSPTPGQDCLSAEDCGNPLLEICAPGENVCGEPQCGEFFGCPEATPVCLGQYGYELQGACYDDCDPTAGAACPGGQDCVQLGVDPTFGVCKTTGAGAVGEPCAIEDNSTSCVAGALCSAETLHCTRACEFFTAEPGCEAGAQCSVLGICAPSTAAAPVGFGEPCGDGTLLAQGCAADGEAFRGICFGYEDPLICEKACLGERGCAAGEFCALRFTSGLGICRPLPVCGDGALGEINEVCDDGNTTSGDGCSGDCQVVEYAPICAGLDTITGSATRGGDTASGWDGFQASCQFGIARSELVRFQPPAFGRLRLWVESPTWQVVSLRSDCADGATELGCVDGTNPARPDLIRQVVDATPLTILVSPTTVLEEGPYTLHVEWSDEVCGDGVVAGREACDDGNTTSGDGCSGDCRVVEYDVLCAAAPELVPGTPYSGDTTGGTAYFAASCSNDLYGSGPDRLHVITAPAAGTLRFLLEQGETDLTLAVYDACGEPTTLSELGCSSVYGVEQVEVPVTAGQRLMVLVEGFESPGSGPYTLTAELLPP